MAALSADQAGERSQANCFEAQLANAIVRAVAYSDIFDSPLTPGEIFRYLEVGGVPRRAVMSSAIRASGSGGVLQRDGNLFALRGREEVFAMRRRRGEIAARQWPKARFWGRLIWALPYVRMVAVTGALAADNVENDADIDFLLVTAPAHLWTARACTVMLCRLAALRRVYLCPNYLVTTESMRLGNESLYAARELAQTIVLHGSALADRLLEENFWYFDILPNAGLGPLTADDRLPWVLSLLKRVGETILGTRYGTKFERWECARKTARLSRLSGGDEARYGPNVCKGHQHGHAELTLAAFAERVAALSEM